MNKKQKSIEKSKVFDLIATALTDFNVNNHISFFSEEDIIELCGTMDINLLQDRTIIDNEVLRNNIDWSRLEAKKLCRLAARLHDTGNHEVISKMGLKKLKVHVSDIRYIIKRSPEFIELFDINIEKLNTQDCYYLLLFGESYFWERIKVKEKNFSIIQQFEISRAYEFREDILRSMNTRKFDGFQTREVLKHTGKPLQDIFDLSSMGILDWTELLILRPEFKEDIDINQFMRAPISNLIDLLIVLDDSSAFEEFLKKDLTEISPYGWEKLIIHNPDLFAPICSPDKIGQLNRKNILLLNPNLGYLFN